MKQKRIILSSVILALLGAALGYVAGSAIGADRFHEANAAVLRAEGKLAEAEGKIAEALALGEDPDGKSKMDTDWLLRARA